MNGVYSRPLLGQIMELVEQRVPESRYIQISRSVPFRGICGKYRLEYICTPCGNIENRWRSVCSVEFTEGYAYLIVPLVGEWRFEYCMPEFPDNLIRRMKGWCRNALTSSQASLQPGRGE